jgi:hypothetical protein
MPAKRISMRKIREVLRGAHHRDEHLRLAH